MPKKRINITLTEKTFYQLQKDASSNCRSISEEIEYRLKTPASTLSTPALFTPENPTGQSHTPTANSNTIITADGNTYKKHPLIWLQENNIDPMDTSHDTYERFKSVFPDVNILEFDSYQQSRRK